MQKFVKIIFWVFIIGGFVLLILGRSRLPGFYNPGYMAGAAFASAIAIVAPPFFFTSKSAKKRAAISRFQGIVAASLMVNAAGALGFYKLYLVGFEYDKVAHLLISWFLVIGITDLRIHWFDQSFRSALLWSSLVVFVGGLAWELFEIFSDYSFGTETLGEYGKNIGRDTIVDIVMNGLGILAASFTLSFCQRKR